MPEAPQEQSCIVEPASQECTELPRSPSQVKRAKPTPVSPRVPESQIENFPPPVSCCVPATPTSVLDDDALPCSQASADDDNDDAAPAVV